MLDAAQIRRYTSCNICTDISTINNKLRINCMIKCMHVEVAIKNKNVLGKLDQRQHVR